MAVNAIETSPGLERLEGDWPEQGRWTYADYRRLPDDGWRYEVIEGELLMTPAPQTIYQRVGFRLENTLWTFVQARNLGEVFDAPIDVVLPGWATPVQPDIFFITRDRLHIVKEDFVEGPPDLVVEILSPSNWIVDRRTKFRVYALAGVREYWIVDPKARTIEVFALSGESYELLSKSEAEEIADSRVLAGFSIRVADVIPA